MKRKGLSFVDLPHVAIFFVISAIVMGLGAYVLNSMSSNLSSSSMAVNNTFSNATSALSTLSSWLPTNQNLIWI